MIFFLFVVIIRLYDVFGEGIDVVYDVDVQFVMVNVFYYISFMMYEYKMWICCVNMGFNDFKLCL